MINRLRELLLIFTITFSTLVGANNCLVQGDKLIGDCSNVSINKKIGKKIITGHESLNGAYGLVIIKKNATANIYGTCNEIFVHKKARLNLFGTASHVIVEGYAEVTGVVENLEVKSGGTVLINGVVDNVDGVGKIIKQQGSIINGQYIK